MGTTTTTEGLPPVEAERTRRTYRRPLSQHPYSFLEGIRYYTGTDSDLIWGPFYERFRAARKERTDWVDFSLGAIWSGIPTAAQRRPGKVARAWNWVKGVDPAPTISSRQSNNSNNNTLPGSPGTPGTGGIRSAGSAVAGTRSWQDRVGMREDWSPSRVDFTKWYGRTRHPADYDDEYFRSTYRALYDRLCDFGETWFGAGVHLADWRDHHVDEASVWEVPMMDQFVRSARDVAHEDRGYINWRDILDDPRHRKWLCIGIFSQIMERRIFDQLLFGATNGIQRELERHDLHWLQEEGFTRKLGRCQIARSAIGNGLVPSGFWDAVDDLAGQTVLIFQPLFQLMCLATSRVGDRDGAAFLQEVHTLLALAGYFQVCTAVSPSIFHFLSGTPGARFQWEEEAHADAVIYNASRAFHRSHESRWRFLANLSSSARGDANNSDNDNDNDGNGNDNDRLLNQYLEDLTISADPDDPHAADRYLPLPRDDAEYRVMDHQRRRGGKVMYAVFPKLTRYAATNVGEFAANIDDDDDDDDDYDGNVDLSDDDNDNDNNKKGIRSAPRINPFRGIQKHRTLPFRHTGEGNRIIVLSRCMVVYYQGLIHTPADQDDGIPLSAHLNEIAHARMPAGALPYLGRAWAVDSDGAAAATRVLRWPMWPVGLDAFWLVWGVYLCVSLVLNYRLVGRRGELGGGFGYGFGNGRYETVLAALLYKPVRYALGEALVYWALRVFQHPIVRSRHRFWALRAVGLGSLMLFEELLLRDRVYVLARLLIPSRHMDEVLFSTIPRVVLGLIWGDHSPGVF